MANTTILLKRGTTNKVAAYTGNSGELVLDTTTNILYVHDGKTRGGIRVGTMKMSELTDDVGYYKKTGGEITGNVTIKGSLTFK
nr:MAG TPA: major tropism determinant [Caudoviricetes sp.]